MSDLLRFFNFPRSSYYYAIKHLAPKPTRPDVHEQATEIFNRTNNGCGHRQIYMCLRKEFGKQITRATVRKVMKELGLVCTIRRKGSGKYSSFRGYTKDVPNIINRQFRASLPFKKCGTDVTQFSGYFGKAYLALTVDFTTNEILGFSVSQTPNMAQQSDMLSMVFDKVAHTKGMILHSDMGWQYLNPNWHRTLKMSGIIQSMSRKGNCLDNAATEQVFGHMKDEFFRKQCWVTFDDFKRDLEAYCQYWNTQRRQVRLQGMTPVEYRCFLLSGHGLSGMNGMRQVSSEDTYTAVA